MPKHVSNIAHLNMGKAPPTTLGPHVQSDVETGIAVNQEERRLLKRRWAPYHGLDVDHLRGLLLRQSCMPAPYIIWMPIVYWGHCLIPAPFTRACCLVFKACSKLMTSMKELASCPLGKLKLLHAKTCSDVHVNTWEQLHVAMRYVLCTMLAWITCWSRHTTPSPC